MEGCPTKAAMAQEAAECGTLPAGDVGAQIDAAAQRALVEGDWNTRQALRALRAVVAKLATAPGQRQMVLVSDGFLVLDDHRQEETAQIDAAIRTRVPISSLDARGVKAHVL